MTAHLQLPPQPLCAARYVLNELAVVAFQKQQWPRAVELLRAAVEHSTAPADEVFYNNLGHA